MENHCQNQPSKSLYDRYTDFMDSSEAMLQHYHSKPIYPGHEDHLHKINTWLAQDTPLSLNKPLVLITEPGCGVKTIISRWSAEQRKQTKQTKQKILSIFHFASNGSNHCNYYYSLYRIIIKLREALKLKQSVDLLEENIRKFFAYWLDLVSSEVERQQIIYCAQDIYEKVVIVIEGADKFLDPESGKEANIAFWLPKCFPRNVKVIVTVSRASESLIYLQKIGCQTLEINHEKRIANQLLKNALSKKTNVSPQIQRKYKDCLTALYQNNSKHNLYNLIEFYSGVYLSEHGSKEWLERVADEVTDELSKATNIKQLYHITLQHCDYRAKIEHCLVYLCMTQKGLTQAQLTTLTKMTRDELSYFISIFGGCLLKHQQTYSIKSTSFVDAIMKKLVTGSDSLTSYHERIAKALDATDNSIKKLQEQTYHLFEAKSYFKLKEILSNIENFLLLFNPHNKYELSRYWQRLEEKGFDPVIEYNKAVEGFAMHYHPSDENIFRIIVQISKFLKEFCDFETYETPSFRHPYIEGNMLELQKIGLLKELSDLEVFIDNSFNQHNTSEELTLQEQIQHLKEKYFPKNGEENQVVQILKRLGETIPDFEKVVSTKIKKKSDNIKILSEIEELNVDVPMNRDKFRAYYLSTLQEFMTEEGVSQNQGKKEVYLDVEDSIPTAPLTNKNTALSFQKVRENFRNKQVKPSLYYYKRWIWIQFPWVCISLNNNYSTTPELRKKIEGDDSDTLELEHKYTKQALLVAIEAREKKRQMFSKKQGDSRFQARQSMSKSKARFFIKTSQRSRTTVRNPTSDLSLNALTKQLQMRKKQLKADGTNQAPSAQAPIAPNEIFLSEISDNCQQDMKFISLRKQFDTPSIIGIQASDVLPKLKWAIKEHTNYELSYIKTHIQDKKKKLNKIIYENKKLIDIYEELKVKESLSKKSMKEHESEKNVRKNKALEDLLKKKDEVITDFCKSLLQKQRLKIILKLCSENKTKNQEYLASLNYLLQNLKKMISCEKENMKEIAEELQECKMQSQKQSQLENEKIKNKKVVERQAENYLQQKKQIEHQIENIKSIISEDIRAQKNKLEHSLNGHMKNKEEKNQIKEQEKTIKQLEDKHERVTEQYKKIKQLFQIEQFDFEHSKKLQQLLADHERNQQLQIAYFERRNRLEEVKKELQTVSNRGSIQASKAKEVKKEGREAPVKRNIVDDQISILMDNLTLQLGLVKREDVVGVIKKKLQALKEADPQKYRAVIEQ